MACGLLPETYRKLIERIEALEEFRDLFHNAKLTSDGIELTFTDNEGVEFKIQLPLNQLDDIIARIEAIEAIDPVGSAELDRILTERINNALQGKLEIVNGNLTLTLGGRQYQVALPKVPQKMSELDDDIDVIDAGELAEALKALEYFKAVDYQPVITDANGSQIGKFIFGKEAGKQGTEVFLFETKTGITFDKGSLVYNSEGGEQRVQIFTEDQFALLTALNLTTLTAQINDKLLALTRRIEALEAKA